MQDPPYSLESERAVLSLVMIDQTAMKRLAPILSPNDFYTKSHGEIYAACLAVYNAGEVVDAVQVATWLRNNGKLSVAGGVEYITDCLNAAPNTANILAYAKTVKDTARLRKLILECERIAFEGKQPHGDHLDFIARSRASILDCTRIAQYDSVTTNSDALRDLFRRMQTGLKGDVLGLRSGIRDFDRLTLGLHGGQLVIIGARPGDGKSSLLSQIATNVATEGIGVLLFSLEMQAGEIIERQLSYKSRVDSTLIRMGRLSPDQWSRVTSAADELSRIPLLINDRSDLTVNNIREIALGAIDKGFLDKRPVGLIMVDYLQRVYLPVEKNRQRREQLDDVAKALKQLAKETGLPVVAAAQVKRIAEGRPDKRPELADLREAGGIENEADVVGFLHHPRKTDKSNINGSDAEFIFAKSRHGRTGIINLVWRPEFTCFEDALDEAA